MNLKRTVSAMVLTLLTIFAVLNDWLFIIVVIFLTGAGLYEFFYLIQKKGIPIYSYTGILIGILIPLSIYTRFELTKNWELLFTVLAFLIILLMQFARKESTNAIVGISSTVFGILYVSWFFSFIIKIRFLLPGMAGTQLLAFLLLVTKSGDVGALLIGSKFGRHLLLPKISPKKSIEGLIGSLIFSIGFAVIFKNFVPERLNFSLVHIAFMGAFFGVIGQLGDLSESLIKRDCGVKDSGTMFPGLGGVLDVLDSVLFSAPVFYLYMSSALKIY